MDQDHIDRANEDIPQDIEPVEINEDVEVTGNEDGEEPKKEDTIQEKMKDIFSIENGPFNIHQLIHSLPAELDYTAFDAYNQNLYLGSTTGDLLHYFELEQNNYMLVSQTKFNSDFNYPIDKFQLLPKIERAFILSNNTLTLFLLPEFAPSPNVSSIPNVSDINLRSYSVRSKTYKIYIYLDDRIEELKVSQSTITRVRKYDFKMINKAISLDNIIMSSKLNNYELINAKSSEVIPLFRVSESEEPFEPIITNFGTEDFIVVSGGISKESNSMVFAINSKGEITNGTTILDKYPNNIIASYPYVVTQLSDSEIQIYKLSLGESIKLQDIKFNHKEPKLNIANTIKEFSNFNTSESNKVKESVVNVLSLVPLVGENDELRLSAEKRFVEQNFTLRTSLTMYGNCGIYLLAKNPDILEFDKFDEVEIPRIKAYLRETRKHEYSKYEQLERNYLITLRLLLIMLHCEKITDNEINKWFNSSEKVDLRILFYLFDLKIFGNVWVNTGLLKFVHNLKALKLTHKCDNLKLMLALLNKSLGEGNHGDRINDYSNIRKTIDVNLFEYMIKDEDPINVEMFPKVSLEEILKITEQEHENNYELLELLYAKLKKYTHSILLIKKTGNSDDLLSFLSNNLDNLPTEYKSISMINDILYILESPEVSEPTLRRVLKLMSSARLDPRELIPKLDHNIEGKIKLIEFLGPENSNDKKILISYYLSKLQSTITANNIWELMGTFTSEYTKDLNYYKSSIVDYLLIKLKHEQCCEEMLSTLGNIKNLCHDGDSDAALLSLVLENLQTFDIGNLLSLLVLLPEFKTKFNELLTKEKIFDLFMSYNDFVSIETYLTAKNISEVLEHYLSLSKGIEPITLVVTLLKRNRSLLNDREVLKKVLKVIPEDYPFGPLTSFLFPIFKDIEDNKRSLELEKALLKSEISLYTELLSNFDDVN
ncbi:hypothetical protein Kpol_1054p5 [Vanderwaltozyma polyspora DSM 70294]|uniref:CNH domain-containing protein n=1 Tax=Vanderwaltozyma polyspora (strain ATCC 22028 / DSM 70294 / BCRC 21397 / CBS 2163 / NBRC 10782 / NRRL Y-8283 / UCD 57-17) TaxID=436907 RepID=A7TI94_VANPO|nr:uncharacterized protein Kpol_1054p5 [Vanderwaltozyma polyspora DSM 70294]EDO17960.1 hypothetical protein Kpol_1054p5 [Vanderwaltozyma polyspora DSM 70294]